MRTKRRIIYIFCFFIAFLLLINAKSYASQQWNSLDYNVTVNPDGSMDVIETWDIKVSETNTLFKDFDYDYSKYSGITNVMVSEINNGVEIPLYQIFEEQYHVDPGCYYALLINNYKTFEIAWHAGAESLQTKTYKIYYTINDAVSIYNDCTELYWQFLGTDNNISGKNITGTIKLPQSVSDIEKLRVWAHGPLSGEIKKDSNNTVSFSLPSLSANTMLEVRIVTEENIYSDATKISYQNLLSSILEEEQRWANEANFKRNASKFGAVICAIFVIIIFIFFHKKIKKYKEMGRELKEKYYIEIPEIQYFREIPNEKEATPANASYLYELYGNEYVIDMSMGKIFSATILDLSLKGLISFEPIDKKQFKIIFNEQNNDIDLPEDEKEIYNVLLSAYERYRELRNYITTKELSSYTKNHYEKINKIKEKMESIVNNNQRMIRNIDPDKYKIAKTWNNRQATYIFGLIILIFMLFFIFPAVIQFCGGWLLITLVVAYLEIILGMIASVRTIRKALKNITILSEKGCIEQAEWKGLERYMEDYSLLKEKSVPDIVLWEKFLVYATTFGIAEKVVDQLKVVHPEMFEVNNGDYYGRYAYWGIVTSPHFGNDGFSNFSDSLESAYRSAENAYNAAHSSSSSGSGGGGGFSSGGGGRRWPVEAAADAKI